MRRLNPVRVATEEIVELAERIGQTVALSVWGNHGPTVVRIEESSGAVHVNMRTGSVMSLLETATGRVFAAFLPAKMIETFIQGGAGRAGVGDDAAKQMSRKQMEAALAEVRQHGLARAVERPIPGVNASARRSSNTPGASPSPSLPLGLPGRLMPIGTARSRKAFLIQRRRFRIVSGSRRRPLKGGLTGEFAIAATLGLRGHITFGSGMITDASFYLAAVPAVTLMGLSKGGFAGVGMLGLPLMALAIPPIEAAAIILPILVVQDAFGVWVYRRTWDGPNLAVLVPGALIGIVAGYLLAARVSNAAVALVVGVISASFALRRLAAGKEAQARPSIRPSRLIGLICGALSGFTIMRYART